MYLCITNPLEPIQQYMLTNEKTDYFFAIAFMRGYFSR